MNNIKMVIMVGVLLVLAVGLASAHEHNFNETKQLIDSGISCDKLTDEQLEGIGEYYMEQMHPGESHDLMHKMMGMEEGTEYHEDFHINIAKMMYCSEGGMMGVGMMGSGMMGSGGMMGMMPMMMNMMGSGGMGMTGNYPIEYSYWNFWNIFWMIFLIVVIVLIIWLIYKFTKKEKESETPINILQKRYAKGEINKKQFEEMKKELR